MPPPPCGAAQVFELVRNPNSRRHYDRLLRRSYTVDAAHSSSGENGKEDAEDRRADMLVHYFRRVPRSAAGAVCRQLLTPPTLRLSPSATGLRRTGASCASPETCAS